MTQNSRRIRTTTLWAIALLLLARVASAQAVATGDANPFQENSTHLPFEYGAFAQGGLGVTEDRDDFKFFMLGAQAGKVLFTTHGDSFFRGSFEYGVQVIPFWQSYTPKFQRPFCTNPPGTPPACTPFYTVGGTYTGLSITPILLRWNIAGTKRYSYWGQGGGGVIWTNHKYPAFGGPPYNSQNDGPGANTSVWNFTPQFGVGVHYFLRPRRSIDFGANAIHISSASLGDRNPGVNASVQFSLGYTWWK